jgi:hypothetical protein
MSTSPRNRRKVDTISSNLIREKRKTEKPQEMEIPWGFSVSLLPHASAMPTRHAAIVTLYSNDIQLSMSIYR